MALPFVSSGKNKIGSATTKSQAHDSAVDLPNTKSEAKPAAAPLAISHLVRPTLNASSEFKVSAEAYALSRVSLAFNFNRLLFFD
ncbi:hypothetical protein BGZ73_008924 [Actinomortierella ambigua]|nr:hypothetical protein BGZ73_008924 [Actinomortierella ambigua]